jgi:hypothetical protein
MPFRLTNIREDLEDLGSKGLSKKALEQGHEFS